MAGKLKCFLYVDEKHTRWTRKTCKQMYSNSLYIASEFWFGGANSNSKQNAYI